MPFDQNNYEKEPQKLAQSRGLSRSTIDAFKAAVETTPFEGESKGLYADTIIINLLLGEQEWRDANADQSGKIAESLTQQVLEAAKQEAEDYLKNPPSQEAEPEAAGAAHFLRRQDTVNIDRLLSLCKISLRR